MPRIPKAVWSPLGPLPVTVTTGGGLEGAMGMFTYRSREITLDQSNGVANMWTTFWHEIIHVALYDSGVSNGLQHDAEEAICDAVGTYLAGMTLAKCLTIKAPQ
jgi:hypothetical protein